MSFSIIAAIGKNNELGKSNDLIWHLPDDLKFFKEKTMNKKIIMGRKTFESLPKLLPGRHHIVLSKNASFSEEVEVFSNINDLLKKYNNIDEEIFIIGGSSIYKIFLDYCDKIYLTEIEKECKDADVYFPTFNKSKWNIKVLDKKIENGILYKHILYKKKRK